MAKKEYKRRKRIITYHKKGKELIEIPKDKLKETITNWDKYSSIEKELFHLGYWIWCKPSTPSSHPTITTTGEWSRMISELSEHYPNKMISMYMLKNYMVKLD